MKISPQTDRSAQVLRVLGHLTFDPSIVRLGNRTCSIVQPGGQMIRHTCFVLRVQLAYNSTIYTSKIGIQKK